MISVEFKAVRKGTCQWCRKEKDEVFDVAFADKSFVGPLCRGDLFRAIGLKLPVEARQVTTTVGTSSGSGSGTSSDNGQAQMTNHNESTSTQAGSTKK